MSISSACSFGGIGSEGNHDDHDRPSDLGEPACLRPSPAATSLERLFDRLGCVTARPFVDLAISPHAGELDCWGRRPDEWWGLVTWCEDVIQPRQMGRRSAIMCSGWAAAHQLRRRQGEDYSTVPRVDLPDDETRWPKPANRGPRFWWPDNAHHVGVLTGAPYSLPDGYLSRGAAPAP
jgi:hypothetical protein